jgi:hypothetical protein
LLVSTPFGTSPNSALPPNKTRKWKHGAIAKPFALDLASTTRAVGPLHRPPCAPVQFRFKDRHRQGTSQTQGCKQQSAQSGCFPDLLKKRCHARGFIKDLGQAQFGHRIDRFSMKDVPKFASTSFLGYYDRTALSSLSLAVPQLLSTPLADGVLRHDVEEILLWVTFFAHFDTDSKGDCGGRSKYYTF